MASLRDEIVTRRAAKNPAQTKIPDTNPRRGTRSNPPKPGRDPKPIKKYVAEASPSLRDYTDRKSSWQHLQDSKAKAVDDILSLHKERKDLREETKRDMAKIAELNKKLLARDQPGDFWPVSRKVNLPPPPEPYTPRGMIAFVQAAFQ